MLIFFHFLVLHATHEQVEVEPATLVLLGKQCKKYFWPLCYLEHLSLHNETGMDPPVIRERAVPGHVAADNFALVYSFWSVLIQKLAKVGYEGKNVYMASYDWKLPFENTRVQLLFQEKAFNYNFWRGTERLMDASYLVRLVEDLILKASLLLRLVQFSFFFFFE
ncbi:hypothetical protein Ahy_A03g014784 [Arachis hypogaea]|uniref:Uncharacterized protein n=1 Tax=Arachis hypogaea TaxID=3818 RepID=A0A445DYK0_ARAHY|nr:hypothetical protein Ahy_A03g014784 [Arachis hypogaea]